jgi:Tol biopolymer transport system component
MPTHLLRLVSGILIFASTGCTFFEPFDKDGLRIAMVPADTAMTVGGSLILKGRMVNRYGDVYPSEHIDFRSLDPALTLSGDAVASATSVGRFGVVAHRDDLADTGWVSVVPPGTLALSSISETSEVVVVQTDGSALERVVASGQGGGAAAWLPGDAGFVYEYGIPGGAGSRQLFVTDLSGNSRRLFVDPAGDNDEQAARVSRDGTWVYFRYGMQHGEIWRVHPDGTGLERVTGLPLLPAHIADTDPDPSPDGRYLAFATNRFDGQFTLAIHDLTDGTDRPLGLVGLSPRWAPDAGRLAYWAGDAFVGRGSIHVAQPDGSGDHQVSAAGREYTPQGLDWSPDGSWLVAQSTSGIDLIQVSTGLTLPLGYSEGYWEASWRR